MEEVKINKIQAYRKALNQKQHDMAKMLGISVVMYSKKNERKPLLQILKK